MFFIVQVRFYVAMGKAFMGQCSIPPCIALLCHILETKNPLFAYNLIKV
jgi:hypothetical protein